MEMEVISDLSTEKLTLLPGKFLSFCASTLTLKDLLLKARKQRILLADLITVSSAMGSDSWGGRDLFNQTRSPEVVTATGHRAHICHKLTLASQVPVIPKWSGNLLAWDYKWITDDSGHLSDIKAVPVFELQDIFYTLIVLWAHKGCSQSCKKAMLQSHQVILDCLKTTRGECSKIPVS